MDALWAPWRMEYILGDKDDGCFLCRILASGDDRNNLVLKRGEHCAVVMNRYPYNNGHLMVTPYRHLSSLRDLTGEEKTETMELLTLAVEVLGRTIEPDGFNIGINLGRVAGAGLEDHIHTHIVPRWNGDTNFMPVTGSVKVIPQSLLDLWDSLCEPFHAA